MRIDQKIERLDKIRVIASCEIRNVSTAVDRTVSSTKILGFFVILIEVPISIKRENIGIAPYSYQVHADIDTGHFTTAPQTAKHGVQQSPL